VSVGSVVYSKATAGSDLIREDIKRFSQGF